MIPMLAKVRAMPLLAVHTPTEADQVKFWLYFVSFVLIALSVVGLIWSIAGPVKRQKDATPEQAQSNLPLCYLIAIAFALVIIMMIKMSEANGSPYGGGP